MIDQEYITSLIVEQKGITRREAKEYYKLIVGAMVQGIKKGEPVKLPGLGHIVRKELPAGVARNPQNGKLVEVPVRFKAKVSGRPFILS